LDVAGKGRFAILTGHGGEGWAQAAVTLSRELKLDLHCVGIGSFLDYEDLYGTWRRLSEVEEAGCVLVRPDLYVAWRSASMVQDPTAALRGALKSVLSLH
jgi:2,4-dichlorophenol 6-monooxygenase